MDCIVVDAGARGPTYASWGHALWTSNQSLAAIRCARTSSFVRMTGHHHLSLSPVTDSKHPGHFGAGPPATLKPDAVGLCMLSQGDRPDAEQAAAGGSLGAGRACWPEQEHHLAVLRLQVTSPAAVPALNAHAEHITQSFPCWASA